MKELENNLVVQSNSLIEASYKLKIGQQKFLRVMASMIKKDDEDLKKYRFKISDLMELFEVKDRSKYKEIPKQMKELMGNILNFNTYEKDISVPFLIYCEYEKLVGVLSVQFHPFLKPFYLYLNKENPYTKYALKNILPLKSVYSIRIYELLKQYEKIGKRTVDIDELRTLFQIAPTEYTRYNDFKRFVILKAQKELPKKTDISFTFLEIKTCRKVTSIKFHINQINKVHNEVAVTTEDTELIKQVQAICHKHSITGSEAKCMLKDAKNNLDMIRECYSYTITKRNINGVVGYMRTLLKGFSKPKSQSAKDGGFNDYDQRVYDFDKLEKKLNGGGENEEATGNFMDEVLEYRK